MRKFLCDYVTEQLVKKPCVYNSGIEQTITLRDEYVIEYIKVNEVTRENSVYLEVAFDADKMSQLEKEDKLLRSFECMQDVQMNLLGYGPIPVFKLKRPDNKTGYLQFNVTEFEHKKACKLVDTMLGWFPHIVRDYDVKRKTALAMAMHRRLGSESLLATLGDILPFVSELM